MEIKINREIRKHNEAIFMGLSFRQLFCSVLAIGIAIGCYFLLRNTLPMQTLSWLCVLCAVPFGAFGFVYYNGMYLEQLLVCIIKTQLAPRVLLFKTESDYESITQEAKYH